jgi:hypothetical protein
MMFYGNEIRDLDQASKGEGLRLSDEEIELSR